MVIPNRIYSGLGLFWFWANPNIQTEKSFGHWLLEFGNCLEFVSWLFVILPISGGSGVFQ
jgi:hypothetical protein